MKKFKGAVFDMDGTLLDTMYIWSNLAPEYLKRNHIDAPEDLTGKMAAMSVRRAVNFLIETFDLHLTPEKLHSDLWHILEDYYRCRAVFKPGAVTLLQKLRDLDIPTVLFSATPQELLLPVLERLDAAKYFSCGLLSCDSVGFSKNRPEAFFAAARHLGPAPGEVMVFEDAWYAVNTAKNAGFTVTAVADSNEPRTAEVRALADFYIEKSWDEFPVEDFF